MIEEMARNCIRDINQFIGKGYAAKFVISKRLCASVLFCKEFNLDSQALIFIQARTYFNAEMPEDAIEELKLIFND